MPLRESGALLPPFRIGLVHAPEQEAVPNQGFDLLPLLLSERFGGLNLPSGRAVAPAGFIKATGQRAQPVTDAIGDQGMRWNGGDTYATGPLSK
ncbi:MAG: hypothetical protein J0H01_35515 [Rhizobiales bacterium]|nr:hypothetical protein [Hyphomicrobiales bacterium]